MIGRGRFWLVVVGCGLWERMWLALARAAGAGRTASQNCRGPGEIGGRSGLAWAREQPDPGARSRSGACPLLGYMGGPHLYSNTRSEVATPVVAPDEFLTRSI